MKKFALLLTLLLLATTSALAQKAMFLTSGKFEKNTTPAKTTGYAYSLDFSRQTAGLQYIMVVGTGSAGEKDQTGRPMGASIPGTAAVLVQDDRSAGAVNVDAGGACKISLTSDTSGHRVDATAGCSGASWFIVQTK